MLTLRQAGAAVGAVVSLTAAVVVGTTTVATASHAAPAAAAAPITYKVPTDMGRHTLLRPGQQLVRGSDDSTLVGSTLAPGSLRFAPTATPFVLELRPDGNLVEYRVDPGRETVVWSTGTSTGTRLIFQSDRNVVLYDAAGKALWATGTAGTGADRFSVYGNGQLAAQDATGRLYALIGPVTTPAPGVLVSTAASPSGRYVLLLQTDGNLVEYQRMGQALRAVWSTRTAGSGGVRLAAQSDGNLVLYQNSTGRPVWASGSHGPATYYQLDVQDDANVVLYRTDGTRRLNAVWASYTRV